MGGHAQNRSTAGGAALACALLAAASLGCAATAAALPADFDLRADVAGRVQDAPGAPPGILGVPPDASAPSGLKRMLVFGHGEAPDLPLTKPAYRTPSNGFFAIVTAHESQIPGLQSRGYLVIEDLRLEYGGVADSGAAGDASRIGQITGSSAATEQYGYDGSGVTVAIVDTGVDFSNPDMRQALARQDDNGHPIMLDPDGQGIVLTNATFYAFTDDDGIIRNYTGDLPDNVTSSVYRTSEGVFLNILRGGHDGRGVPIPVYNSFFPQVGSGPVFNATLAGDIKIGNGPGDYIESKSGIYRLGVIYQGALTGSLARVQSVPVLLTDPNTAGVYDTITPDMSTSWEDYTRYDLEGGQEPKYDFDFTDEKPIVLGSGNEFLVYDSDGDGMDDYSAGTVGARVLDVYGVIRNATAAVDDAAGAVNGTLLYPIDPDGEYFGMMSDFMGHGTKSAAAVASRGVQAYDIYNDTGSHRLAGAAPGASILPVKALWLGDALYAWMWAAGFDNDGTEWEYGGSPRAEIISNSWGISHFPNVGAAPGMDVLSLVFGMLSTPHSLDDDYAGVTMVTSSGNSGPGYGTLGLPNASPLGITVGATTNNVYVGYGPFADQPRFGATTDHLNDVVDFSSRGPGIVGDPKPDLVSAGAHGFVPSNVIKLEKNSAGESFLLFGGTSMSGPLVAGSAAILIEAMTANGQEHGPHAVRNILMSTADDIQNDALTQGAGLVNAKKAVDYVHGNNGVFAVHNDASYGNIREILQGPIEALNSTMLNLGQTGLPDKIFPVTSWFAGRLAPGERSTATFTVENPTDRKIVVDIVPERTELIQRTARDGQTTPLKQDLKMDDEDTYAPNYIRLNDVRAFDDMGSLYDEATIMPEGADLLVLNLNFDFDEFMNSTNDIYADDLRISSLYLYDWVDEDQNTRVTSDELSMVTRGGSWGTVQELRVSEPATRFEGIPMVGVYPVPTKFSFWVGNTGVNATSMNYTLSASYYERSHWDPVWVGREQITVPPGGSESVEVTVVAPGDYQTGVYQGFLRFSGQHHAASVPVTFAVVEPIGHEPGGAGSEALIRGVGDHDVLHGPGYVKGAFDMANRYMAGDWRQYYFDVQDPRLDAAAVELSWQNEQTNLAVFAVDPDGRIVQTNVPSGTFGHFMGWPSLDWLGTTPFSQGGGFFPTKNKDGTSTILYVPLNQTGTYSLMVHSTLFAGNSTTEPISLSAKFTTVGTDAADADAPVPAEPVPEGKGAPPPVAPGGPVVQDTTKAGGAGDNAAAGAAGNDDTTGGADNGGDAAAVVSTAPLTQDDGPALFPAVIVPVLIGAAAGAVIFIRLGPLINAKK